MRFQSLGQAVALLAAIAAMFLIMAILSKKIAHGATPCLSQHDSEGRWGYRIVDGRRCWFRPAGILLWSGQLTTIPPFTSPRCGWF